MEEKEKKRTDKESKQGCDHKKAPCKQSCEDGQEEPKDAVRVAMEQMASELERINRDFTAAQARADEMTATAQRLQADFDNFRKRNADALSKARFDGQCEVVLGVLPAMDVFDSALAMITDENVVKGISMVKRQIMDNLAAFDVKQIAALDCDFDPEVHEAIEQVECDDPQKSGKVVEVLRQGFKMKDKVLRHSLVKVAK